MNGHGGARVGAGRPRKSIEQKVLEGTATIAERRRHTQQKQGTAPPATVANVPMPGGLTKAQSAVWADLAPHALAAGTLTPGTAFAFRALCELVVVRRAMLATITREGWQRTVNGMKKKHPLATEHRGLLQREEAGLARFCIAPVGKEMEAVLPPVQPGEPDPFKEFDVPGSVQ